MRYRRDDVVACALRVLDDHGLADLTMRRLAQELGVQPSALYHHFRDKQTLLAAVADEILVRGARPLPDGPWEERVRSACHSLRDACLAWTDGAEVVATARAFRLGAAAPYDELTGVMTHGGVEPRLAGTAARTLLHFVLGHVLEEQTHRQAGSAGAIAGDPTAVDHTADFDSGLAMILAGVGVRTAH